MIPLLKPLPRSTLLSISWTFYWIQLFLLPRSVQNDNYTTPSCVFNILPPLSIQTLSCLMSPCILSWSKLLITWLFAESMHTMSSRIPAWYIQWCITYFIEHRLFGSDCIIRSLQQRRGLSTSWGWNQSHDCSTRPIQKRQGIWGLPQPCDKSVRSCCCNGVLADG